MILRGKILCEVRAMAQQLGGAVRASDLELQGWSRKYAVTYLKVMASHGHFNRIEPGTVPLKPGKWEPAYQPT